MATADKDPKSPATTSLSYDSMSPSWTKIQTVLNGTVAMRAAGEQYLPRHEYEGDPAYLERLAVNTLLNSTKLTLDSWVGRPFSDPVIFEVPSQMEPVLEDVDLTGNEAQVFCRNWFSDGVAKALSHVLVDFPRTDPEAVRTLADDAVLNLRPYWVHVRPEQLFFAAAEIVNGREFLREIRIMEEVVEQDGFAEVAQPQIRQIVVENVVNAEGVEDGSTAGKVVLWRMEDPSDPESDWFAYETYPYSLNVIPLVTFYSDRDGLMHGTPPLEDLADLNIAHWQSTSDQRAILTVARFPILALSGGTDDNQELVIGPRRWLYSPDTKAKFYYVEHSGAAIEAGRKDLMELEAQMAEYGAEFLKKRPQPETATARALDAAEATSPLQDVTLRFMDAINQVLALTAAWMKLEDGGTAEVSTDFGPEEATTQTLTTLRETRKMRDISRENYLKQLMRLGLLDDEFDIEEDANQLEVEAMNAFGEPPVDEGKEEEDEKGKKVEAIE